MDNKSLLLFALFIIFCVPFAISQELDDEREFSYDLNSPIGPDHWGDIDPEWRLCNTGDMQSPIDLTLRRVQITSKLGRLDINYQPANTTLVNRGHDIMLRFEGGAGFIRINGTEYQLNQLHWHTPTEHAINGQRFNLELHLVHQSIDEKVAVVGILYKIGHPDSFLTMIEPYLREVACTEEVEKNVGIIDPRQIKFWNNSEYYRYNGSLTTPPCDENVIWTVFRKVRTASREQVRLLIEAVHDGAIGNARPLQALNNRVLKLYIPDDDELKKLSVPTGFALYDS